MNDLNASLWRSCAGWLLVIRMTHSFRLLLLMMGDPSTGHNWLKSDWEDSLGRSKNLLLSSTSDMILVFRSSPDKVAMGRLVSSLKINIELRVESMEYRSMKSDVGGEWTEFDPLPIVRWAAANRSLNLKARSKYRSRITLSWFTNTTLILLSADQPDRKLG